MPGKVRCHETDDGYEVLIREDLADEFIATARVGGHVEGRKVSGVYVVRHDETGHEDRYVIIAYGDVQDPYAFRRFCRWYHKNTPSKPLN